MSGLGPIIAGTILGALVGGLIGIFGTRDKRMLAIYMAFGALGALLYVCLPWLRGSEYLNSNPKSTAIVSALFTCVAVLFTSGRRSP